MLEECLCIAMRPSTRTFKCLKTPSAPGKAQAFQLSKIATFKFPPPRAKMCSNALPYSWIYHHMPLLKNNRRRLLSSLIKFVYKHANTWVVTLSMMMPSTKTQLWYWSYGRRAQWLNFWDVVFVNGFFCGYLTIGSCSGRPSSYGCTREVVKHEISG